MNAKQSPALFAELKAANRLPSPPGTALRVLELSRRDDVELQEIADAVMSDPVLSGRLLKFANMSIVATGRDVTSIRDAVLILGLRTVKLISLGFSLVSPDIRSRCPGFDLKRFWSESFARAAIARHIKIILSEADREEAFTAALLAGIGRLALAQGATEAYVRVMEKVGEGYSLIDGERHVLGVDHIQFGAQLLTYWELPARLVHAVEYQNEPTQAPEAVQSLANSVHLAIRLAPAFIAKEELNADQRDATRDVVENALRLDEESWKRTADQILDDYLRIAGVFNVEINSEGSIRDLYEEAKEEATRVGVVARLEDAAALEGSKALLRRASIDPLTGMANRARFDERLDEAIQGVRRGYGDVALLLFDLDHFKRLNDTYDRRTGDLVLKRVARAVRRVHRETDLLARYAGEAFAILASFIDRKAAALMAARVQLCVERLQIPLHEGTLRTTISLGMALTADYESTPEPGQLLADADAQLYISKQNGRNTWSYLGRSASQVAPSVTPAGSTCT
jgi:diguanylate cyclase (GGDEF)-like protein